MGKRVMIIDDDRGIRNFLQKALEAKGFKVEAADRGAVGLQKMLGGHYDLALIDINMPQISGPAICSALRRQKITRNMPVVMMTAMFHNLDQIEQAKKDYGATEFLLKPFKVEDLYWLLDTLFADGASTDGGASQEGQLSEHFLPLLLNQLYSKRATGLLTLNHHDKKKVVYFKGGYPIFARSNILAECLGQMLIREGLISKEDCEQSIEGSNRSGRLQGTVLIEMGLLSPEELHEALTRQVTEKLLSAFAWTEGTYGFAPAKSFKKTVTEIELSPAALILQGITQHWSRERLDRFLQPHCSDFLVQSRNPLFRFQEMGLSRRGEDVLEECLGDLTLEQLLKRFPLSRLEVQQVVAALLLSGMIVASSTIVTLDQQGQEKRRREQPQDEALRKEILASYDRILNADYYAALGVGRQCDAEEVRRAYYQLVKEYHPDRYIGYGLSQDMEHKVSEIFQYLTHAYSVLSDPAASSSYFDELVNGPRQTVDVKQVIAAETAYQKGKAQLMIRHYREAAEFLSQAVALSPKEPEYLTQYAWAVYKSEPDQQEAKNRALEMLISSRELNPRSEDTYLYLGYVYRALNKERQSQKSFELAVQVNPACKDALRELRLINLRKENASDGGILQRFFKSKKS
ncbi:MAG: hypothetical protein C0618_08200 [Desulfuromonas sp.]|nr:MAG: hypothetical protein C0618_08200 [Desulfuromonas sp.]